MKEQNVYLEEEDSQQPCISVRWVISRKVVDGKNITKTRLCARGFEELQGFPTNSPCCSQIGVKSVFALIASQNWNISSIDVKTAFLQGRKIERIVYFHTPKTAKKPVKYGNYRSVCIDLEMPVDNGIYV